MEYRIRPCTPADTGVIDTIINDAAIAYKGVIPDDCWHEPYMSRSELEAEIEQARQAEAQVALANVRETIAAFGFTADDLFGTRRKSRSASNGAPRFRHPETGETWGGRGPRPRWLKGKDPEQFRVRD